MIVEVKESTIHGDGVAKISELESDVFWQPLTVEFWGAMFASAPTPLLSSKYGAKLLLEKVKQSAVNRLNNCNAQR